MGRRLHGCVSDRPQPPGLAIIDISSALRIGALAISPYHHTILAHTWSTKRAAKPKELRPVDRVSYVP